MAPTPDRSRGAGGALDIERLLGLCDQYRQLEVDIEESLAGLARREPVSLIERLAENKKALDAVLATSGVERLAQAMADVSQGDARQVLARIIELLDHHPSQASLLRSALELSVSAGEREMVEDLLTRLGLADSSQATAQWISRLISQLPTSGRPVIRAALLSSFTIEPVADYFSLAAHKAGMVPDIYVAPFNTWDREMIDPRSGLRRFDPEITFMSVAIDDLLPILAGSPATDELEEAGKAAVDRLVSAAKRLREWSRSVIVVHGFHSAFPNPPLIHPAHEGSSRAYWLNSINGYLGEALRAVDDAYILDVADILLRRPAGSVDNPKIRHLAAMRLVEAAAREIGFAYARCAVPLKGLTRKCIVVDLDGTLWGGIVGEDGPHGIRLGDTSPGSEYREFQKYLKTLTEQGFLLAICSKNNEEDALQVIRTHEGMVLRETDFSTARINWLPKPENVRSIADELSIGTDSLVFLDDSPREREIMRQMLPEVLTPELPSDPSLYRSFLFSLPELQKLAVTREDRMRVEQYRTKHERERLRASAGTMTDYLRSLEITVVIAPGSAVTLSRIHQLFQRTNQFNITTKRYALGELEEFISSPSWRLYTLTARDRFGDHGLVACALVAVGDTCWRIDSLLMSCRVIGLGVESALLATLCTDAHAAGITRLVGEFIPTAKNEPARDLYRRHGFEKTGGFADGEEWILDPVKDRLASPDWIRISFE